MMFGARLESDGVDKKCNLWCSWKWFLTFNQVQFSSCPQDTITPFLSPVPVSRAPDHRHRVIWTSLNCILVRGPLAASRYDSCTGIWNILQNYSQNWRNVSFSILVTIRNQTQDQGHRPPLRSQPLFSLQLQSQNTLSYFVFPSTASTAILFLAHFVHFHVTTTYWYLQI